MSDSISEVKRSPLLGEHTDEILRDVLRFDDGRIAEIKASGALGGADARRRGIANAGGRTVRAPVLRGAKRRGNLGRSASTGPEIAALRSQ